MFFLMLAAVQIASATPRLGAARCPGGSGPTVLIRITGFSNRLGQVRVRLFGPPVSSYFDKKKALARIEMPVPPAGPVEMCLRAPGPGVYALDVRHDANGDGRTDRHDGGGASGNPHVSLLDILLSRRPDPRTVQFRVGTGPVVVPVTLMYLRGGSFQPLKDAD